ncbi:1,2-phenylacetyl-CoA epoxidase subunit PaaD [Paremcibacter congregatus]|uniref:Phenylacetate-CoA oxygenase subunit PaaJ n=1 Tax=Paremcibacter congregatus TaxID=2043170 RepID=A0A2G4YWE6_9PROT|nr:1,2-phenylacetyl-CoA epoxidase subunit PaaD [Paremcibacter congregatus]PHZ86661.1 phenylacetate-CoA oxygenase subunit PaaJ [Paremcibacter congregatus]QDE26462.1 phenylacetate-CoA oxygenase subunit PaaJ [Paremcibacter congregatus]|tara:strand:+ start:11100 stop:11606 length:507 start_codon:yes stop_codon:yes gene_type:complete
MVTAQRNFDPAQVWTILEEVKDPEIPVLSIVDLGIAREVKDTPGGQLEVVISPTYSGCPAMNMLEEQIRETLIHHGYPDPVITTRLSPAWTTDWMSEAGKQKLEAYGIAPPEKSTTNKSVLFGGQKKVSCPQCKSDHTEQISEFGSTACKALYRCLDCREPFDYFKCI